jgi:hypothetical protein
MSGVTKIVIVKSGLSVHGRRGVGERVSPGANGDLVGAPVGIPVGIAVGIAVGENV